MRREQLFLVFLLSCFILISNISLIRATNGGSIIVMGEYCNTPPFITQSVPPIIAFVMERDHKLYYEAYNDASDLDGDGRLDTGYKHSIDYYGYFDPYKCYTYVGSGANAKFVPVCKTANKYCGGGQWSGNFLNWLAMSRMDVLKKVLYGGTRINDSASETVLGGTFIPQDCHSWGKEYSGSDTPLLTPFSNPDPGKRHLFAVTSLSDGETPRIRVLKNRNERIWQWVSIERPVCGNKIDSNSDGVGETIVTPEDYFIRVKVCDPSVGLESNCRAYPAGTYKPVGLLQKYGEGTGSKVCSKSFKPCNSDADCRAGEGFCIDNGRMFFGLFTGSYTKNLSGGVLRKNIWSITDETNPNTGIFQSSENVEGNIVLTLDRMKIIGFRYGFPYYSYEDPQGGSCGWITNGPLEEGKCRSWGNPIAEILYETLRYFTGKGTPTSDYTYTGTQDSGLNLSKPDWGIRKGSSYLQPLDIFPWCTKPFIIILSDTYPSYDSDKVPGSDFGNFSGDLTGLDVRSLANFIGAQEGIEGKRFIGQTKDLYDFICSPKTITNLGSVRGLCPEEPTKQGSFYSAAIAYYGNSLIKDYFPYMSNSVNTYSVVTPSPVPDINIKVGGSYVRIVPIGKSVSGCLDVHSYCAQKCILTRDSNGLHISNCSSGSFCPSNQIVDFYPISISYDANNNITYAKFRINFEDVEQGADHDMDAIVEYEIQSVGSNQIMVKLTSVYAAGCLDQVLGFVISGTTEDGIYLPVRDKDSVRDDDTPEQVANLPLTWSKTFTVSGETAGVLKDPLWYASKWGGFTDMDGSKTPNLPQEWDKDNDGNPDTYFYVSNPLELERKLESAILDILKRTSSGTAASVLSTSTRGAVSMIQAFFTPRYVTVDKELTWTGHLQYLWLDPKFNIREDSIKDDKLILNQDKIIQPYIDLSTNDIKVRYFSDNNADGKPDFPCTPDSIGSFEEIKAIWRAEANLLLRDPNDRKIYTFLDTNKNGRPDGNEFIEFKSSESSRLAPYFRVSSTEAEKYIRYIRGEDIDICLDPPSCTTFGHRDRTILGNVWKLGDIVHSTPRIVGNTPLNTYHIDYMDTTYQEFVKSSDPSNPTLYETRDNVVYFGANDGMLHCVNMGKLKEDKDPKNPAQKAHLEGEGRGEELWAYIPYNLLPQTPWIGYPDYCHIYYVDGRTLVFDASINGPSAGTKTKDSWRTILIGTMRLGGKPISITGDFGLGNETRTFRSAIFAMDVTDPRNPSLLWEFTDPELGFTTSFPTVVRFGDKSVNGEWYVVFGNGPENFSGRDQTKSPKLYVVDLRTGALLRKIEIASNIKGYLGDLVAIDPDKDYQVDTIYAGTVEMKNNPPLVGRLLRIQTFESSNPSSWVVSTLVNPELPITASPEVVFDERRNIWVLFGTGIFLSVEDKTITYPQSLFGIRDDNWNGSTGSGTVNLNQLFTMDLSDNNTANDYDVTAEVEDFTCYCNGVEVPQMIQRDANGKKIGCASPAEKVVTYVKNAKVGTTNWKEHLNTVTTQYKGWRLIIPSRERCITRPFVIAGLADFLVYTPTDDPCAMGGETKMYTLFYQTGTAFLQPIYLTPSAVSGSKLERAISLGPGAPPPGEGVSAAITKEGNIEKFVQVSTGVVIQGLQQPPFNIKSRIVHWLEK